MFVGKVEAVGRSRIAGGKSHDTQRDRKPDGWLETHEARPIIPIPVPLGLWYLWLG